MQWLALHLPCYARHRLVALCVLRQRVIQLTVSDGQGGESLVEVRSIENWRPLRSRSGGEQVHTFGAHITRWEEKGFAFEKASNVPSPTAIHV